MNQLEEQLKSLNSSPASEPDPRWIAQVRTKLAWVMENPGHVPLPRMIPLPKAHFRLRRMMFAISISLVIVMLAGSGITYAAQGALPDSLLYPVKIASEDVLIAITKDPMKRANLGLEFANRRVEEINILSKTNKLDADTASRVQTRYQTHVTATLLALPTLPQDQAQTVNESLSQDAKQHARITQALEMLTTTTSKEDTMEIKSSVKASLEKMRQLSEETSRAAQFLKEKARLPFKWNVKVETETDGKVHVKIETEEKGGKKKKEKIEFRAPAGVPFTATTTWPREEQGERNEEESSNQLSPSRVQATTTIWYNLDGPTTTSSQIQKQLEKMKRILKKGSLFQLQSDMRTDGGSIEQRVETKMEGSTTIHLESEDD
ncbi:MAG: DUF5667 domain-containing protein [Patescibacteria group bacterium]